MLLYEYFCRTYGGPNFAPGLNATDWEKGLANNLVAVDRQGDPIETMITTTVLPELPEPTVAQVWVIPDCLVLLQCVVYLLLYDCVYR